MVSDILTKKIANPYAEALLDLAKSQSSIHAITSDINSLRGLLKNSPPLADYLMNPITRPALKCEIIEKIITSQVTEYTSNFLMILANRNRIQYIDEIIERYLELVYELANIRIVEVNSAQEFTEEQEQNLITKLQAMTGATEIKLLITVDASLIGGFLIKMNSQFIDLTVKGQLTELAKHLDSALDF